MKVINNYYNWPYSNCGSVLNQFAKRSMFPFSITVEEGVKVHVPKAGDKKQILELSTRNAKYFRMERFKQARIVDPDRHENRIMAQMKKDLRLTRGATAY